MDKPQQTNTEARAVVEKTVRVSYGKLLALLAARSKDIAASEDALADAFAAAIEKWPDTGVPKSPEAWLLTAARRKLIDQSRRTATSVRAKPELERVMDELQNRMTPDASGDQLPDERLKLMLICAHPAIDPAIRTPLILQTILGFDAQRIARVFLTAPATMSQRLVRAKRKIAEAGIPFETPEKSVLAERIAAVLDAIYAAFSAGVDDQTAAGAEFADEALFLGELVIQLLDDHPEAYGLFALMLYIRSRREAFRPGGVYTPMHKQDTALWDQKMIARAEHWLIRASKYHTPGRYQIEAAIQSAHITAKTTGEFTVDRVLHLYDQLLVIAPTTGARVGKAGLMSQLGMAQAALDTLEGIDEGHAKHYQAYWAVRAHALAQLGRNDLADRAYDLAITLSDDPSVRRFLIEQRALIGRR